MSVFEPARQPWPDRVLAVFRIVATLIFFTAGTTKLFGYPPSPIKMDPIPLFSQIGIGAILEVVLGTLILIGLFTRPAAFIASGEMAVAYWQFHAPASVWPSHNQGIPAILLCFFFLYLSFAGPGAWSVDRLLQRRRAG